jgi:hypothetical protein
MLLAGRRVADYANDLGADIRRAWIVVAYDHMGALLTDTVLQAGLNYKTVVLPRVQSVLDRYPGHYRTSDVMEIACGGASSAFLTWNHGEKIARFEGLASFLYSRSIETVWAASPVWIPWQWTGISEPSQNALAFPRVTTIF